MTFLRALRLAVTAAIAIAAPACASVGASRYEWRDATTGAREVPVTGAEIVRIDSARPLLVGERFGAPEEGSLDLFHLETPRDGRIVFRASIGARSLLLPPEAANAVLSLGRAPRWRDSFAIEDDLRAWAHGPWRAAPPPIEGVPKERSDALARADEILAPEASRNADVEIAARAARRVIAERASILLRAPHGRPWFEDTELAATVAKSGTVRTDGPGLLRCAISTVTRGPMELHVAEHGHPRADAVRASATNVQVLVPIPPGAHEYAVTAPAVGTAFDCSALRPVARMGHSSDEVLDLERARRACARDAPAWSPVVCAVASALAGDDESVETFARKGEISQAVAEHARALFRADGYDGALLLETRAQAGDLKALETLAAIARADDDDAFGAAFARAARDASSFAVVPAAPDAPMWTIASDPSCKGPAHDLPKVEAEPTQFEAAPWRHAWAIHLVVEAPCDAKGPIVLDIEGEEVRAEPSAPATTWTVIVPRQRMSVKRIDRGPGTVRIASEASADPAAECSGRPVRTRTFSRASDSPKLAFTAPPALEVWLRDGTKDARIEIAGSRDERTSIAVSAAATASANAFDDGGVRWVRAGRAPLPSWAIGGITVKGDANVAVRALERMTRAPEVPKADARMEMADPLDEARVLELSRAIKTAPPEKRGALYKERATLLGRGGETRAATEDAAMAKSLGALPDLDAFLRTALRTRVTMVRAFGLEPDFDANARRCAKADSSARARIGALDAEVAKGPPAFDLAAATRALTIAAPDDPRLVSLERRTLFGSRWREILKVPATLQRVPRPLDPKHDAVVSPDGLLRVRSILGSLSDSAAITAQRTARFAIPMRSPRARIDVICAPRAPSKMTEKEICPLEVLADGNPHAAPVFGPDGRGSVAIDPKAHFVDLRMRIVPAEWGALVRVVFEQKAPGTRNEPGVGWVLETPRTDRRFLLVPGKPVELPLDSPALLRVNAWPEPGPPANVVVITKEGERPVPLDASPVIVPVLDATPVRIEARGGTATIDLYERGSDPALEQKNEPPLPEVVRKPAPSVAFDTAPSGWRDAADAVPLAPRGVATWATLQLIASGMASNWREGAAVDAPDAFAQQALVLRRHFEAIRLFGAFGALVRERNGDPSAGGRLSLIEDVERIRFYGAGEVYAQRIEQRDAVTVKPRGFVEYLGRISPSFSLFPRLGFDGWYTTLPVRPIGADHIDDDVYSPTRFERRSLPYAQAVAWWTPYFDLLFLARLRAMLDASAGELASASARAGGIAAIGPFDVSAHVDGSWFPATTGARTKAGVDVGPGAHVASHFWLARGSAALEPSLGGSIRVADARWQAFLALALVLGEGRRRTDFSSMEMGFYDSFSGGAVYRGSASGVSP